MKYLSILLITLYACSTPKSKESLPEKTWTIFIGSYSENEDEGIYTATFDGKNGKLSFNGLAAPAVNPSYLSVTGDRLYSVSETGEGDVLSFFIDRRTLRLIPVDTLENIGSAPCYLTLEDNGFSGYVANYMSGDVIKFEMDNTGRFLNNPTTKTHSGSGPDPRQEGPHAHSIDFNPDHSLLYAADLGADKLFLYDPVSMDSVGNVPLEPGDGPRHFTFNANGDRLYVINELSSTVSVFSVEGRNHTLLQKISTLPEGFEGENKTADIHVHPSGKYLYGSNRGHESIVHFRIGSDGKLENPGWLTKDISWPRNFQITPDGNWLLVANRNSNSITSYFLNDGIPGERISQIEMNSPVCISFY